MTKVTATELKLAIDSLPEPDSVDDSIYTIFLTNPDRALMFHKVVRGDGWDEAWRNEWILASTSMSSVPADPIMDDEEFDSMIDAMKDAEQQVLLNVAQTLLDEMEANTMRTVANWCDERADVLEAETDADIIVFDEAAEWTSDMFAALFKKPGVHGTEYVAPIDLTVERIKPIKSEVEMVVHKVYQNYPGPGPLTLDCIKEDLEEAPDFDLFEAAKGIRKAAHDFNAAVTKAQQDGQVVVKSSTRGDGTVQINCITLEMKL